jgi:hypothetical protein
MLRSGVKFCSYDSPFVPMRSVNFLHESTEHEVGMRTVKEWVGLRKDELLYFKKTVGKLEGQLSVDGNGEVRRHVFRRLYVCMHACMYATYPFDF